MHESLVATTTMVIATRDENEDNEKK